MGIKNFCCWQLVLMMTLVVGCESFRGGRRPPTQEPIDVQIQQPVDVNQPPPEIEKPEFLAKKAPKVGLILGGGGALSFAHIGVLQELEKQKIPVVAIAGMEWGSLVATTYAKETKAHGVEWKLLKLPHQEFVQSGFFTSAKGGASVSQFSKFLDTVYGNHKFSDTPIATACTFNHIGKENVVLKRDGRIKNAMQLCWPHAPHFKVSTVSANLNGVSALSQFLRREGAELVIYVDVVSKNQLFSASTRSKKPAVTSQWIENKYLVNNLKAPLVDEVLAIPVSGYQIDSYKELRSIVRLGQIKSKSLIQKLAGKYAF